MKKIKVKYEDGKDEGLENWRVYIEKSGDSIIVSTENFKNGFISGESWENVYSGKSGGDTYNLYVSVITKFSSRLESFKPLIIDEFHRILEYNIKVYESNIKRINGYINDSKDCLVSDVFKQRLRDEALDKILGDN